MSVLSTVPESTPGWSKLPSALLTESARPASQRSPCASAPKRPVVTSPSRRTVPFSAGASASKPPTAIRPQAAKPGPPASPPPAARWKELPSSSSRPVMPRAVPPVSGSARDGSCARAQASSPASGSSSRAAPGVPESVRPASPVPADSAERSMRWPPSVTCEPPDGPDRRPVTASTTWPATVRPKRDSHIFCNGSEFSIRPTAKRSASTAPRAFSSLSTRISVPSSTASSSTGTATVFAVSPGAKRSVPLLAS